MKKQVKQGKLLIAEPSILNDKSFARSVILLTEHSEKSSVGFILNRPTKYKMSDLVPDIQCNLPIYEGGPVEQDNLYFIHKIPHLLEGSLQICDELYWGGNFEKLQYLLNHQMIKVDEIRFFLGYSGWQYRQLNDELDAKYWFIAENTYKNILNIDNAILWKKELLKKGDDYKLWINVPADVSLN